MVFGQLHDCPVPTQQRPRVTDVHADESVSYDQDHHAGRPPVEGVLAVGLEELLVDLSAALHHEQLQTRGLF